ncbi:spore germination protein KB [Ruminiclostridium sufflavum DSM 19573]|uniref:Spore germination protein KB n=1 Tax=Ruminiclostridium sufflavum DSM 19573 TaxID=1121337 RepID=A0A318XPU1_9FIRM|nr:endospore germination permease [Ruminiclostridium sufflavum]PYG90341.1 spore germination protein KB [Ruminiclostridium sufflavum DSM 19573]
MSKIKISNLQFALTISAYTFGVAPLFISSSIASISGRDAWISAILAAVLGLSTVYINMYLGKLYPDKTLIETICLSLGKWLGNIVSILFIFIIFETTAQIIWYVGDFLTTTYMPEVSAYPIDILFTAALIIAMLYGLEAMCRAVTIFFSILFPFYFITLIMLFPNINITNVLPVLEYGITPVIKGTVPLLSLCVWPLIVLNMIYPSNIKDLSKAKPSMLYGYLLGMFVAFSGVLMCILVLGDTFTAASRFPLFILTQEVNVGTILTRFEAVSVAVWLNNIFISAFFFFYAAAKGLSQIFKLSDHKKIVLPLGLILAAYSQSIYKNVPFQIEWDTYVWPPVAFTFGVVLPVVMIIASICKKAAGKI